MLERMTGENEDVYEGIWGRMSRSGWQPRSSQRSTSCGLTRRRLLPATRCGMTSPRDTPNASKIVGVRDGDHRVRRAQQLGFAHRAGQ